MCKVLFPGDKGWWKAWSRNPFNWIIVAFFVILCLCGCSKPEHRHSPYYMESMDQIATSKYEDHVGRLPPATFPTFKAVKREF